MRKCARAGAVGYFEGVCGKRDGQLLYPNRVAVVRSSGDIIVTERSPTHQVCPKKSSNHNAFVISYHCLTNFPCNDELSWLFTSRFRTFYLNCKKIAKSFKISVISILLTFMNLLVNNQLSSLSNSTHHCGT